MGRLSTVKAREAVAAFQRLGFTVARQTGSHFIMDNGSITITIPNHNPLRLGTLKAILKQAGVSEEEFIKAL